MKGDNMETRHPDGKYFAVVDDSFDSFWAYLMDRDQKIIADCRVANKPNIKKNDPGYYRSKNAPPPAKEEFIEKNLEIKPDDKFLFSWNDDLKEVIISINGFECIKFKYDNNRGFSKLLKKECPWGNKWE